MDSGKAPTREIRPMNRYGNLPMNDCCETNTPPVMTLKRWQCPSGYWRILDIRVCNVCGNYYKGYTMEEYFGWDTQLIPVNHTFMDYEFTEAEARRYGWGGPSRYRQ
jgi:hypothetical protein